MQSHDVFARLDTMGELPVLPQVLLRIQKVTKDERSTARDLAQVICGDQVLTARILRIVNSAYYARARSEPIKTVERAVVVLGFQVVRKLALGLSVFDMMRRLSRSPHIAQIAEHSTVVAAIARRLAEVSGKVPPEEAFVAALVHDIGKLVLIECAPDLYEQALRDHDAGQPLPEAERERFGLTHERAGRKLAAKWKLPRDLQQVIGDHHGVDVLDPPDKADPVLLILAYADAISRFRCDDAHREAERAILEAAGRALGTPVDRLGELVAGITDQIGDLAESIEVPLEELRDYAALVSDQTAAPAPVDDNLERRTAEQLALYRRLGEGMARGESKEMLLELILRGAQNVLGLQRVILFRVDRDAMRLRRWMTAGIGAEELSSQLELPLERSSGALALSALHRRSYYLPAAQSVEEHELAGPTLVETSRTSSFASVPVVGPQGVVGVLWGDLGPDGPQLPALFARELSGLAVQAGLVVSTARPRSTQPV